MVDRRALRTAATRLSLLCAGSCIPVICHAQETTMYRYDALGRLAATSTSGGPNSGSQTDYALDHAGNRVRVRVSGVGGSSTPAPSPTPGDSSCTIPVNHSSSLPYSHNGGLPTEFSITRAGACSSPTAIGYSTRYDTATSGVDYVGKSGTISVASSGQAILLKFFPAVLPEVRGST